MLIDLLFTGDSMRMKNKIDRKKKMLEVFNFYGNVVLFFNEAQKLAQRIIKWRKKIRI